MNTLQHTWQTLTTPLAENEEEARRERMTRVVFTMVSVGLLLMSIIVPIFEISVDDTGHTATWFMFIIDGLLLIGWIQILHERWYLSRYLLPVIFLALSAYTIIQAGLITTGVLHLVIAVVLTSMLFSARAQWVIVIVSEVMYLFTGWLAGERDLEVFFMGGIAVGFALSGIAALQWYASTLLDRSFERLRHAETASRVSARKIRAIFDTISDGIATTDLQGNLTDVNDAILLMFGYTNRDALVRRNAFDFIAKAEHPRAIKSLQETLILGNSGRQEYTMLKRDGSEFAGELIASVIKDEQNQPVGFVAVTRNITSRKLAEIERENLIRELAGKNRELEEFTYTVSHDLKAPIITISGFLGYLEQDMLGGKGDRIKKDIGRIHEAVSKMHNLLTDLLELSRIGRVMNAPVNVPFEELVRDAIGLVQGQLEKCTATVRVQPKMSMVHGDRQRLTEVLQNIIDNAAKYMGAQTDPIIEIGQCGEDAEYEKPIFFVKDNGIGIAPEYHERIFGLFNKLNTESEGTGIGLALVKRIIEFHGGRVWVDSEPGKGSTFYFTLPTE